ncbi:MAG: hypothetical protein RJA29_2679 [Pseudomonadota bacterium]
MNLIVRLFEPLYRWLTAYMGRQGMILYGIFDCDCACVDYTPVANASAEAAEIAAQLGREQLAEARRQYDENMAIARPIVDAQARLMDQAYEQGNETFNNFRTEGRPLQQAMRDIAMGRLTPEVSAQAEAEAARAGADVQAQLSSQRAATTRSMQRMGINPNSGRMAAMQGQMDVAAAAARAGAMNTARNASVDRSYARMGDVLNTYSGMASQAPTFYQTGTQAGNSAVNNQMAPGGAYMGAMQNAGSIQMQGRELQLRGLSSILDAQANYTQQGDSLGGILGGLGGLAMGLGKSGLGWGSDRRLKQDIELVGRDERTGLNLYEFSYIDDPDMRRYVGVMADEVIAYDPRAVSFDEHGYARVDYARLGIPFKEVV